MPAAELVGTLHVEAGCLVLSTVDGTRAVVVPAGSSLDGATLTVNGARWALNSEQTFGGGEIPLTAASQLGVAESHCLTDPFVLIVE